MDIMQISHNMIELKHLKLIETVAERYADQGGRKTFSYPVDFESPVEMYGGCPRFARIPSC